jgi:hypothetical protein
MRLSHSLYVPQKDLFLYMVLEAIALRDDLYDVHTLIVAICMV